MRNLAPGIAMLLLAFLAATPALAQGGTIVAWGFNDSGQCQVPPPNVGFAAAAGGCYHSLGLESEGGVVAWGANDYNQCSVPLPNAGFTAVSAGWMHSLGLKSSGAIVAWGRNNWGQCNVPAPNTGFVAISAGWIHSLGLKSDGTILAWGNNDYGQCTVPAPNENFVAIAGGFGHSLGLKSDGTIVAWGYNLYGQCDVPAPNADFVAISVGGVHSLGLKSDGTIVAWGHNGYGQCNVPAPNVGFLAVSGGYDHTLGLRPDGTIVAWGYNEFGQCNVPAPNAGFTAIAGGSGHSLALRGPEVGACCCTDGVCVLALQADCVAPSVWQGAFTTCTPNPCAPTPVLLESWTASSLAEGLRIRWELPLGTTGALYRAWRDASAGPHDMAPTPDAELVSSTWINASAEGIIEIVDRGAPRGTAVRYFLESSANGGEFIGPVEASWDPPALAWSAGPTPFRDTVRLASPGTGPARAEVFNSAGRLVRTLVASANSQLEWNGRDDAGRKLSAGVYMVSVITPVGKTSGRVVLLR